MKLVLASNSKSRKKIFDMLGFNYQIVKSKAEEISNKNDFSEYVMDLSRIKANSVAEQLYPEKCVIVAADSIIYMGDKKFEKPKTLEEAYENIKILSGNVNHAITGVTIKDLYKNQQTSFYDITDVYFNDIDEEDIKLYWKGLGIQLPMEQLQILWKKLKEITIIYLECLLRNFVKI